LCAIQLHRIAWNGLQKSAEPATVLLAVGGDADSNCLCKYVKMPSEQDGEIQIEAINQRPLQPDNPREENSGAKYGVSIDIRVTARKSPYVQFAILQLFKT
jgi:hypothetical protein